MEPVAVGLCVRIYLCVCARAEFAWVLEMLRKGSLKPVTEPGLDFT